MYPRLSDEQAHAEFDTFQQNIYVEARFTDAKLAYLAVMLRD
jgi:hypothetical protein